MNLQETRNSTGRRPEKRSRRPPGPRMGVAASDVDFRGANSMAEMLRRVAWVAPHRELNMMQTAEILMQAGKTASISRYNVCITLRKTMNRSKDFERVRRGWYRYQGPPVEIPESSMEDEQQASEEQYATPGPNARVAMRWRRGKVEYGDSANLNSKLRAVADHTHDRVLEPGQTALRLLRDGQSTAKWRNLTRVVRRTLRRDPEFAELPPPTTDWYLYQPSHPP